MTKNCQSCRQPLTPAQTAKNHTVCFKCYAISAKQLSQGKKVAMSSEELATLILHLRGALHTLEKVQLSHSATGLNDQLDLGPAN